MTAELPAVPGDMSLWTELGGASGRFFISIFDAFGEDASECLLLEYDRSGSELSRTSLEIGDGLCGAVLVADDGRVLRFRQDEIWVGNLDGNGEWVANPTPLHTRVETSLSTDGVLVADTWGFLRKFDWLGELVASYDLTVASTFGGQAEVPSVAWSGATLGVALRQTDQESFVDRVYFQRFDVDLVPIDPEPILVVELDPRHGDLEALISDSPLVVGWDGSEFGVVVVWTQGRGEWGAPTFTDIFRFGTEGELHGSFALDRGSPSGYVGSWLGEVFSVPESDRLVVAHFAEHWVPAPGDEGWEIDWGGLDLAPLDLQTGERVAEDGRLTIGGATARLGGRLGLLWTDHEILNADGTEWIDHLMFTVLDCAETFGVP